MLCDIATDGYTYRKRTVPPLCLLAKIIKDPFFFFGLFSPFLWVLLGCPNLKKSKKKKFEKNWVCHCMTKFSAPESAGGRFRQCSKCRRDMSPQGGMHAESKLSPFSRAMGFPTFISRAQMARGGRRQVACAKNLHAAAVVS